MASTGAVAPGPVNLHQLVERQIEQIVAALLVDQHFARVAHDLLHGVDIQAVARDARRLVVFRDDLAEAAGIALRAFDHALLVAFGLLVQARRRALGLRHDVVGIGLAFVFLALAVLPGFYRIVERGLHLLRRLRILHRDLADADARVITIENFLHQLLRIARDLRAALVEHEVHRVLADDFAYRGFRRLQHAVFGRAVLEQIFLRVLHHVLHGKLDVDDVGVIGEHQRFLGHLALAAVARSDFDRAHLRQIDDFRGLDRIRQMPVRSRLRFLDKLAEAQHHAALARIDDIKAAREPHQDNQPDQDAGAAAELRESGAARRATAAAALAPEQRTDLLIEVAHQFVEVRRTLILAAAAPPLRIVERHQYAEQALPATGDKAAK